MCMNGGMYGCPGGRTTFVAYPSASAIPIPIQSLHAPMHAYNACVVRALRRVFVSRLKPQASGGGRGVTRTFLRFSSLLIRLRNQPNLNNNTHTVTWTLC